MGQYNYPDKAPKFLRAEDLQLHKMLDYKQQQVVKFHLITVISRTVHKHLIKIQRQNDVFVKHWIHPRQWQRSLWMWPWPLTESTCSLPNENHIISTQNFTELPLTGLGLWVFTTGGYSITWSASVRVQLVL